MSKKKIVAAIAVTSALLVTGWYKIHQQIIVDRFPDENPKLVKKHYNVIMREISTDQLNVEGWTETSMDAELLRRIHSSQ